MVFIYLFLLYIQLLAEPSILEEANQRFEKS